MPTDTPTPVPEPIAVSAADFAALLGLSLSGFYGMKATGRIGPVPLHLGRAVRYRADEIRAWVAAGAPPRQKWLAMQADTAPPPRTKKAACRGGREDQRTPASYTAPSVEESAVAQ
jgi:predicted DNA-binding transcriptional regulator AlpA